MIKEELRDLYKQVNSLSDLKQTAILATLFGNLSYYDEKGDNVALDLIRDVEKQVSHWGENDA